MLALLYRWTYLEKHVQSRDDSYGDHGTSPGMHRFTEVPSPQKGSLAQKECLGRKESMGDHHIIIDHPLAIYHSRREAEPNRQVRFWSYLTYCDDRPELFSSDTLN